MGIVGKDLEVVARQFADQLQTMLANTITYKPLIPHANTRSTMYISFREAGAPAVEILQTKYGPMELFVGHLCSAVEREDSSDVRLRTLEYAYYLRPHTMTEPLFRWEFVRPDGSADRDDDEDPSAWCRHHIQGNLRIDITDDRGATHQIALNDWHTPSGWVALEDIVRFCIVDLGVKSRPGWNRALKTSYRLYRTQFTTPGE
jgi:hypothetical protein